MNEEILGDFRCVLRSYKLYLKAKDQKVKNIRLNNFGDMAHEFEKKWNHLMHKNYKFFEWILYLEGKMEDEQVFKRGN